MAVRRFQSNRRSPSRRKFVWARLIENSIPLVANGFYYADALGDFEAAYGADLLGATVVRVRGEVKYDQTILFGMRVFTQSTFGELTTVNQTPSNDPHADWMIFKPLYVEASGTALVWEVDVKSKRRLEELGQSLLIAVQNVSSTAGTMNLTLSLGLKLP